MNGFQTHGFKRDPQTHLTRHGALLLLALDDEWKNQKAQHAFTGGFDPKRHFKPTDLMVTLRDAIRLTIKKVIEPGDVYAHLLFLSEHKLNATDVLVRNHPGGEQPGQPIFQMGKAGEELCDLINSHDLRRYIECDATHWQAIWLYARLLSQGECGPKVWTPADITSLTGLNRGQIAKAVKLLVEGFVAKGGDTDKKFTPATLLVDGTRRSPKYRLRPDQKVSSAPEIGVLDFGDDNVAAASHEPPNGAVKAAAAFVDILGAQPVAPTTPPVMKDAVFEELGIDVDDEDTPDPEEVAAIAQSIEEVFGTPKAKPVGAHANLTPTEVNVLMAEANRLRMSIDSLVTTLLQKSVQDIMAANKDRRAEEIAKEEAAITAAAEEAQRLASEARSKLDEVRRRKANLEALQGVPGARATF